jgi:WD40-like Beta Propeller Repeat
MALLMAGCAHSDPFAAARPGTASGPFQDTRPRQLTLNLGFDNWPSWTPDGTQVYYSSQVMPPGDVDRCIDLLPRRGGTRLEIQCPRNSDGITDELEQPTSDGTWLAWSRAEVPVVLQAQYSFSIWIAPVATRAAPRMVQAFPYDAPSGKSHGAPLYLQWHKPGVLLYLGAEVGGCCRTDTLRFGEQVVLLDLTGPTPVRTFVPGTERASAVTRSEDGSSIYYTFYGDSRVYQQVLATGDVTVLHDFGAGHIVRDPDVSGNRLVAVLDGKHNLQNVVPFGMVQIDYGGILYLVDLATGIETRLADSQRLYRHPRLAPGGSGIAAEGYPFSAITQPGPPPFADTTVVRIDDIWILEE